MKYIEAFIFGTVAGAIISIFFVGISALIGDPTGMVSWDTMLFAPVLGIFFIIFKYLGDKDKKRYKPHIF